MRVLVISSLYPKGYLPSAGTFVERQVHALRELGVDVIGVISPVPWSPRFLWLRPRWRAYGQEPVERVDSTGLRVLQPRVPSLPGAFGFPAYGLPFYRAMRPAVLDLVARNGVDVIHAHVAHPMGTAALSLARELGVPVVVTVHGQDLQHSILRNRWTRQVITHTLSEADRVVLVSPKLLRIAESQGITGSFEVIPNGVDPDALVDEALLNYLLSQRPRGARVVLTLGNLVEGKGQEWVLRGLGSQDCCWVVGDGPQRLHLERIASELGLQSRVRFWGAVRPNQVSAYMKVADVFALPSSPEAFGIVYLEAMRAGLPVIACRGEGDPNLLRHEETALLVEPRNASAVAAALARLAHEPELVQRLASAGRMAIAEQYTLSVQAQRMQSVYASVTQCRQ